MNLLFLQKRKTLLDQRGYIILYRLMNAVDKKKDSFKQWAQVDLKNIDLLKKTRIV